MSSKYLQTILCTAFTLLPAILQNVCHNRCSIARKGAKAIRSCDMLFQSQASPQGAAVTDAVSRSRNLFWDLISSLDSPTVPAAPHNIFYSFWKR